MSRKMLGFLAQAAKDWGFEQGCGQSRLIYSGRAEALDLPYILKKSFPLGPRYCLYSRAQRLHPMSPSIGRIYSITDGSSGLSGYLKFLLSQLWELRKSFFVRLQCRESFPSCGKPEDSTLSVWKAQMSLDTRFRSLERASLGLFTQSQMWTPGDALEHWDRLAWTKKKEVEFSYLHLEWI